MVSGKSSPVKDTGVAAPTFVDGAIAAKWPAANKKVPAEAAWLPLGQTKVITGTLLPYIEETIFLVDSRSPPGVLIRRIIKLEPFS